MNYVYLITTSKAVKIGISSDPEKRLSGLQTSHHETLKLYCTFACQNGDHAGSLERMLHQHYLSNRIRGEWFDIDPEKIIDDVLSDAKFRNLIVGHTRHFYHITQRVEKTSFISPHDEKALVASAITIVIILIALSSTLVMNVAMSGWIIVLLFMAALIFMIMCASILAKTVIRTIGD